MSFPKAKMKRFNEVEDGDKPPVGAYDPKLVDKSISAPFMKSNRFKKQDQDADSSVTSVSSGESSTRKAFQFKMPARTRSFTVASDSVKVQECEKEIKRLLNERSSLLKQLTSKEEDCRKLDGKLQAALREKTSLKASLASFERENKELRRMSEILTMKVNTMESVDRKKDMSAEIMSLSEQLMRKGHEVHDLRAELTQVRRELEEAIVAVVLKNEELNELQKSIAENVRVAELQLEATRSELQDLQQAHHNLEENSDAMHDQLHTFMETISQNEALVAELQSQKSDLLGQLTSCQKELETKGKTAAEVMEALRRENLTLLTRVEETAGARQRDTRLMAVQLDNAQQKLQSTEDCSRALQEYRDALVDRVATLKETITDLEDQQMSDLNTIKEMKVEILNLSSKLSEKEEAQMVANSEITSLKEEINKLQKLKLELIQLTTKSNNLERELDDCAVERETLKGELMVNKLALQAAERDTSESKSQLDDARILLDKKAEVVELLETELKQLHRTTSIRHNEISEKYHQLARELQAKDEAIGALNVKIEETSREYHAKCEEFRAALASTSDLKMSHKALEASCAAKDSQITNLNTKLDTKTVEKQFMKVQLETEKMELEGQLKSRLEIHYALEQEAADLRRQNEDLKENLFELASKYELTTAEMDVSIECVMGELLALRIEFEVCQDELTNTKKERDALEVEMRNANIEMTAKEETLTALVHEKMLLVLQLETSMQDLKGEAARLQEVNQNHAGSIERLSVEVQRKDVEMAAIVEKYSAIEEKMKMRDLELAKLSEDQLALQTNLDEVSLELESKKNENVELKTQVDTKKEEVASLAKSFQDSELRAKDFAASLEAKRREVVELRRDVTDLHCTLKAQSGVLIKREVELKTSNKRLDSANGEMKKVKGQISDLQLEKRGLEERVDALADDLSIANKSLESEIVVRIEMNADVEAKKEAIANLGKLVAEADSRIAILEGREQELTNEKRLVEEENLTVKSELEAARAKIEENNADNEQRLITLREDLKRLEGAKHDAEMSFLNTKTMRNLLHGELRKAQLELQESEEKLESSKKAANNLSELITALRASEVVRNDELNAARRRTEELEQTVSTQKTDLKRLTAEVTDKRAVLNNLRDEVTRLSTTVEDKDNEIAELRIVVENNQQLMMDKSLVEDLTVTLKDLSEKTQKQEDIIETLRQQRDQSNDLGEQQKRLIERHLANMEWYKDREKDLLKELQVSEASIADALKKLSDMESQHHVYREQKEKEGRQNEELLQSLTNEYENKLKSIQEKNWKQMYEELLTKVEPFMEQLNAYEIERKVLLSKNRETKSDLEKLSDQYATLLGHQNHRQKIHYVTNLKEENLGLKEENTKLWTEVLKFRKMMPGRRENVMVNSTPVSQRKPPLSSSSARPFDSTAKHFKRPSDKENASPLRDRNFI